MHLGKLLLGFLGTCYDVEDKLAMVEPQAQCFCSYPEKCGTEFPSRGSPDWLRNPPPLDIVKPILPESSL